MYFYVICSILFIILIYTGLLFGNIMYLICYYVNYSVIMC